MVPSIPQEIKNGIIKEYLLIDCIAALIFKPDLGYDDKPNQQEFLNRRNASFMDLSSYEVGGYSLNGYKRFIFNSLNVEVDEYNSKITFEPTFYAINGDLGPFTHLVLVRGALVAGADIENGNNRGDPQGRVIAIKPVGGLRTLPRLENYPSIPEGSKGLLLPEQFEYKTTITLYLDSTLLM